MQSLEDLLDELDDSREKILVVLAPLSDAALTRPGAVGDWSLADLLAILTAWEAELITGLMRIDQGRKPGKLLDALKKPVQYDQTVFAANHGRSLDQIFDDWQRVRVQLEGWLETFTWRDLTKPGRYKWLKHKSLADLVLQLTVAKEKQYLPAVTEFSDRWQAAANDASIIPLTAVHPEANHDNNGNHVPD